MPITAWAETPGKDGDVTITGTRIVNEYGALAGSANVGATTINVSARAVNLPSLAPGDLVLIYQPQGASIDTSDSANYGAVTNLRSAGRYEYHTIASVSGNTLTFQTYGGQCVGLTYSYTADGGAQVIRVPQYRNLTVTGGARIDALPWDGSRGGVIALHVQNQLQLSGAIDASGRGFRGGTVDNETTGLANENATYRSAEARRGGQKGEGIAGYGSTLWGGQDYARGAAANGGGGGNGHNAGGGGGANGDDGRGWGGQGVPSLATANWAQAWNIDPSLNASTRQSGGGRGGYTYARQGNPLTIPPGDSRWGNDLRRELGGLGGRPMTFEASGRLFFGGGGGAGDGNNGAAGAGGRGGGLVFVMTGSINGGGEIRSNGTNGANTTPAHNDAPGGGGAGGTIVVQSAGATSASLNADGGNGGNQLITNEENEGPGGGGGGGVIATSGGASVRFARGGANGETTSPSMSAFRPNGATQGGGGQPTANAPSLAATPFCRAPDAPLTVTKDSRATETAGDNRFGIPGADKTYTLTVTNPGAAIDANSIFVIDLLPSQLELWTGDFDGAGPATASVLFTDGTGSAASGLTCCTAAQIAYSNAATGSNFSYTPNGTYDPAALRIRIAPSGTMPEGYGNAKTFTLQLRTRIK